MPQSYLSSMRRESERGETPSRTDRRERRKVVTDEEVPPLFEENGTEENSNEHLR